MTARSLAIACALDAAFGDPAWFPHPVRAFGFAAVHGSRLARAAARGDEWQEAIYGGLLTVAIAGGAYAAAASAIAAVRRGDARAGEALEIGLAWTTLAARDLLAEARSVDVALRAGDLGTARRRVARIVGRDTAALDASGVARATIETLAESLCDGVAAPLLALALGGAPLAVAFKAASTLDSTIGHIEPPYTYVGRIAAHLDDVLCYVPARLAALAIAASAATGAGRTRRSLATWRRDGARHASPNAGRPEAAIAGALGVRLGGGSTYDGIVSAAPYLGAEFAPPHSGDVLRARRIVAVASALLAVAAVAPLAAAAAGGSRS